MDAVPPTLPFHLAKAYGVKPTVKVIAKPAITVTPVAPGVERGDSFRVADRLTPADKADLAVAKTAAAIKKKLVAAVVPGGVAFEGGVAKPAVHKTTIESKQTNAPIPFYRHPADKNAAATAINVGTRIDLEG